jgi:hypothetical protein
MSNVHELHRREHPPGIRINPNRARPHLPPATVVIGQDRRSVLVGGALAIAIVASASAFAMAWIYRAAAEERDAAIAQANFWRELALVVETQPTVRLRPDGVGFECSQFQIPDAWHTAVAAECAVMGGLLQAAKSSEGLALHPIRKVTR